MIAPLFTRLLVFACAGNVCVLKDKRKGGCLATNISSHVHDAIGESFLYEHMKQSLPDGVLELDTQRSRLNRVESRAIAVAQQYNKVSTDMQITVFFLVLAYANAQEVIATMHSLLSHILRVVNGDVCRS